MILGLDISTSCTGAALISNEGKLLHVTGIKPEGDDMFEKAVSFRIKLNAWLSTVKVSPREITSIYVEESLQGFRPGLSSAGTLLTLARFNGVASFISMLDLGIKPEYINVTTARKLVNLKIQRTLDTKQQVLDWAVTNHSLAPTTRVVKSGKNKGESVIESHYYDIADAIVVAMAGFEQRRGKIVD